MTATTLMMIRAEDHILLKQISKATDLPMTELLHRMIDQKAREVFSNEF